MSLQPFAAPPRRAPVALTVALTASVVLVLGACAPGASPSASGQPSASAAPPSTAASGSPSATADGASGSASPSAEASEAPTGSIILYTSVPQTTVDPVLVAFGEAHPDVTVELFRAPTGELSARIAADLRDQGRAGGDILWLTDPLSVQAYAEDGMLRSWSPRNAADLDPAYVNDTFWGTRVLNMLIVRGTDVEPTPTSWEDLTDPAFAESVAIPNPAFAGSAFGALGYFAQTSEYGLDFYRRLKDNGAIQLNAPDEVTTGVAEGRFKVGMTLDFSARSAAEKGSPVELVWPEPGAIAMYGPIGVVEATENAGASEAFVEFVLSQDGQEAIAGSGWEPVREGAGGPEPGGEQVRPDWAEAFGRQEELLEEYATIFGG